MYRTETTMHFNHNSAYHVLAQGDILTITNDGEYDAHNAVCLTELDQVALLHLLVDRQGFTLVATNTTDQEEDDAPETPWRLVSAQYTANRVSTQATGDTERLTDALCDVINYLITKEG